MTAQGAAQKTSGRRLKHVQRLKVVFKFFRKRLKKAKAFYGEHLDLGL